MVRKNKFFTNKILDWGSRNYRYFIWREKRHDFFIIFISEFLLRKTKSESVENFLVSFLKYYNSFESLKKITLRELKAKLKPLGLFNERAKALKKIASEISYKKEISSGDILNLPHCGRYIANAIDCFYYDNCRAIVDNNIQRLFNRFFSIPKAIEIHKADYLWDFANDLLPRKKYVEFNYYLLDFSALICKSRKPMCIECPIQEKCDYLNG